MLGTWSVYQHHEPNADNRSDPCDHDAHAEIAEHLTRADPRCTSYSPGTVTLPTRAVAPALLA